MNVPPPDDTAHHDARLVHDLAVINTHISRYIFHFLDADAGRTGPIDAAEERELAQSLKSLADRLQLRAEQRESANKPPLMLGDDQNRSGEVLENE